MPVEVKKFLKQMVELQASDLFFTVDHQICAKVNKEIVNLANNKLTSDQTREIAFELMTTEQRQEFLRNKECNFAIQTEFGRFRVNVFVQRSYIGIVLRRIDANIPTFADLNISQNVADFAMLKRGLVIVTGATGVGKSSTLAAMIGHRNQNSKGHIVTVEDPIEFIHQHQNCIVTQREVGIDTESFSVALKHTLRQAPDVIVLGEVRDDEAMKHAINFAETGHLCLLTLHANNANQALDRILNFFPSDRHSQILADLSLNLRAIIAQQLLPEINGKSMIPALEIMVNTQTIAEHIRSGEFHLLKECMQQSNEYGMQTFDQSLLKLYKDGKVSYDNAINYADSANEVRLMIKLDSGVQSNTSLNDIGLQKD